jgi:hypothetical protein
MGLQPEHAGGGGRINADLRPPGGLIAEPMDLAMVPSTKRHRELITDFAPECWRLRKSQMMGVCRTAATNETGLLSN